MEKEYDIPEELCKILDEVQAYQELRKLYVKLPFGFKKAIKCSSVAEEGRRKFWGKVHRLYPDMPKGHREFDASLGKVVCKF